MSLETEAELRPTYQDVIRLDIRMHDVAFAEQTQSEEELVCVCPHCTNVETNILPKPLDNVSEVHATGDMRSDSRRTEGDGLPQ